MAIPESTDIHVAAFISCLKENQLCVIEATDAKTGEIVDAVCWKSDAGLTPIAFIPREPLFARLKFPEPNSVPDRGMKEYKADGTIRTFRRLTNS